MAHQKGTSYRYRILIRGGTQHRPPGIQRAIKKGREVSMYGTNLRHV